MAFKLFVLFVVFWVTEFHAHALTLISNCAQLQAMENNLAEDYELTGNINCASISNFNPVGDDDFGGIFTGTFNGRDYVISNLAIDRTGHNIGLFARISSPAIIQNVGVENADVSGQDNDYCSVGVLVGYVGEGGVVKNSYATGTLMGSGEDIKAGGLLGRSDGAIINCYAVVTVTGTGTDIRAGGLVGSNPGTVLTSYAAGMVSATGTDTVTAGLAGGGTQPFSYWNSDISAPPTSGSGIAATTVQMRQQATYKFWDFTNVWSINEGVDYPKLRSNIPSTPVTSLSVSDCETLQTAWFALAAEITLLQDIDCSEASLWHAGKGFSPIGSAELPFSGRLLGNGHLVYNITIKFADNSEVGMFGALSSAHVEYLGLRQLSIYDVGTVGGLAGIVDNSTILGCFVEGEIISISTPSPWVSWATIGLLAGDVDGSTLESCHASGNITGIGVVEGGREVDAEIGGLIGDLTGSTLLYSYANVFVSTDYAYGSVGGLAGYCSRVAITQSYSMGDTLGTHTTVGGLAGSGSDCLLSNSYVIGVVSSEKAEAGGLFGSDNYLPCINSYASGCVSGKKGSGGLVGSNLFSEGVQRCYWDTKQTGQSKAAGGTPNFDLRKFGRGTSDLYLESTFEGWDFQAIWTMSEGGSYPFLRNVSHSVPVSLDLKCESFSPPFSKEIKAFAIAVGVIAAVALLISFVMHTWIIFDDSASRKKDRPFCLFFIRQYPVISTFGYLLEIADKLTDLFLIRELLQEQQDDLAIASAAALGLSYIVVLIGLTKINEDEETGMPYNFFVWVLFWPALSPELNHLLNVEGEVSTGFAFVKVMSFLTEDVSQFAISVIFLTRKGSNDIVIAKLAFVMIVSLFFLIKLFCYDLRRKEKKSGFEMR